MLSIVRRPGLIDAERDSSLAVLRWHPAAVWLRLPYKIDTWKHQLHVVEKAALTEEVRRDLFLALPEERTPPEHAEDQRMLRSVSIVVVGDELRAPLLERGVRVWTVGYHRNPDLFRLVGEGGPEPHVWIEDYKYTMLCDLHERPIGRPRHVPWYGGYHDIDWTDRILRAATKGTLDEPSILLANRIVENGWDELTQPRAQRKEMFETVAWIDADPKMAEECFYADLKYTGAHVWNDPADPIDPAEVRAVESLKHPDGPRAVHVEGIGAFFREVLPRATVTIASPTPADGWLPMLRPAIEPPPPRTLELDARLRYARAMKSGPWWEI